MIKRYNTLVYEVYWIWEYVHPGVYRSWYRTPRCPGTMPQIRTFCLQLCIPKSIHIQDTYTQLIHTQIMHTQGIYTRDTHTQYIHTQITYIYFFFLYTQDIHAKKTPYLEYWAWCPGTLVPWAPCSIRT
jgi:hypothetical protein